MDGTAGLWCVNAGHNRPRITAAIREQAGVLDFAPTFQLGHPLAVQAAGRIAAIMPEPLRHVFFANSGSEAVDTALKIALAYHKANGQGARTRFVGRDRSYHGVGFGGLSVGGIGTNRRQFGNRLLGVDHMRHTHSDGHVPFTRGQPAKGAHLADDLLRFIQLNGAETIAAVIVEPMAGSTGVLPPPVGYLERLREISAAHGILLIFDEVITGFGRLGAATAAQRFGVIPDILTLAKGVTNATVPMGAAVASRAIFEAVVGSAEPGIELFHGYTYSGHPLACAASIATLDTYAEERLFERAAGLEGYWADAIHSLQDANHVIDVRSLGLVAGVELQPRPGGAGQRAREAFHACFDAGLLVRYTGDTLALSPPLIIERGQIDEIASRIREVLSAIA
jgi:beta-alanine--pyruvate transaminase